MHENAHSRSNQAGKASDCDWGPAAVIRQAQPPTASRKGQATEHTKSLAQLLRFGKTRSNYTCGVGRPSTPAKADSSQQHSTDSTLQQSVVQHRQHPTTRNANQVQALRTTTKQPKPRTSANTSAKTLQTLLQNLLQQLCPIVKKHLQKL